MAFNGTKFKVLRYGFNEELKHVSNYMTPEAEDTIDVKSVLRDLGIIMNDQATWKNHVDKVCSQVNQKAGLIQGHIEYCSQILQPLKSGELQRLEHLQKILSKKIPQVKKLNY